MFSRLVLAGLVRFCTACNGSGKNKYGGRCNTCDGAGSVPALDYVAGTSR
jgi:DnaJ-class molecular chaperone